MGLRECPLAEQSGGDRRLQALGQAPHRIGCLGDERAVAGQDHRPLRGVERRRHLHDHVAVALFGDLVAGDVHLLIRAVAHRCLAHVLGHVDQYRTGPPGGGDVVRLAHDARDGVGLLDQIAVLYDRHGDAEDVRLLEGVLAKHAGDLLAGDHQHRHRVHVRGHDPGQVLVAPGPLVTSTTAGLPVARA